MTDTQLLPPLPTTITNQNTGVGCYYDSGQSSPFSRDAWEDQLLPIPGGAKLRMMCSYGGHIIPRPHDKSLCYVGGDTRIVVVDRNSSLSNLTTRLSRTLLNGRPFTLKYQLPNEDLDSLVSVTTDEDLENMIDEYDRTMSRLRLFVFFLKPETATSMGSLLDDAKSETWFVDALNGTGLLPRGLSDSVTIDCLVNLDDNNQLKDLEPPRAAESRSVENSSSFGSSSSSPSTAYLPPIRLRVEDRATLDQSKVAIDEEFANPPPIVPIPTPQSDQNMTGHRAYSDDEGVPVGFRKPPLPLQPPQHNKPAGHGGPAAGFSLPSPDSITSECSITSANSFSRPMLYQDNKDPDGPNTNLDPNYTLFQQQQQQQQQFVHYISRTAPTGAMPVQSYYQIYGLSQQQQQQQPPHQQYPAYVMPLSHQQSYNMSIQPDHGAALMSLGTHTNVMVQPEMTGAGAYATASTPLLQVPANQFHQQFVSYVHNPTPSGTSNYGYQAHAQHNVVAPLPPS